MRRVPIIPTLIVAAAVAVMIGLGIWQLQRAAWKERLIAQITANQSLPALDLDPLLARGDMSGVDAAFRRVLVTCTARDVAVAPRAGRNLANETGYSFLIPCRPDSEGLAGRIQVAVGWARMPAAASRLTVVGLVAGRLGSVEPEGPIILTAAVPTAPLTLASAPPSVEEIPDNHLAYAGQWFFFAALAAIIYILALRRRLFAREPAPPREP